MKTMRLLFACLLGAGASWVGAVGPEGDEHLRSLATPTVESRSDDTQLSEALNSRPLFVEVDAAAPGTSLVFWIELNGSLWLHEALTLGVTGSRRPAYEILAHEPEKLADLYRLAAQPGNDVRVGVSVAGRVVRASSFGELVASNRVLKTTRFQPEPAPGRVVSGARASAPASAAPAPDDVCRNDCYSEWWSCVENCQCGGGNFCPITATDGKTLPPDIPDCSFCDQQYDWCVAGCPPPPCTPTSTTFQTTELIGLSYGGWQCFYDIFYPPSYYGKYYQMVFLQYKVSTYRRTTNCDGSQTTTLIQTQYTQSSCNRPINLSCVGAFSYPWSICYI